MSWMPPRALLYRFFLMLTGALLLGSDKGLVRKASALPQTATGSGAACFSGPLFTGGLKWLTVPDFSPADAIRHFFRQPAEIHLWYLYALAAIYLLLPVFSADYPLRQQTYGGLSPCLSGLYSGSLCAQLPACFRRWRSDYANLDILGGYAGYVLLGWYPSTAPWLPNRTVCAPSSPSRGWP